MKKSMLMRMMGVVMKVLNNHEYIIYFLQTKEEMIFNHAKLRPHHKFIDNKWVEVIQEDIGGHPPIPLGPPPLFLSVFQFP